jgi:predicted RNA-binding Zn ribbon-like protein
MLRVTWEWLGRDAALDVGNTVAVSAGVAHDLLEPDGEYERWAKAAAGSEALGAELGAALVEARPQILALRDQIRDVLFATAAGDPLPGAAVAELNRVSRKAPAWLELSRAGDVRQNAAGNPTERLLAVYARSAMEIAARGPGQLRVCGAPSCGMLYRPSRERQRWCSTQCGTRARVARHYRPRRR